MTDSSSRTSWLRKTEAPDPRDDPNLIRTFEGYRMALSRMTIPQLLDRLTSINAELQAQSQSTLVSQISSQLSDSIQALDRLQVRSPRMAPPTSAPDRGASASRPFPGSPQPSALDRLASSKYMGPKLAAKLVVADARKRARARGED